MGRLPGMRCSVVAGAAVVAALAGGARAGAQAFDLVVQSPPSMVTAELCLSGVCDTDVSAVTGMFTIELDDPTNPTEVTLTDFSLVVTEPIDLFLNLGIFGGTLTATASGLTVSYGAPGTPITAPLDAMGGFALSMVPAGSTGMLSYTATGLACIGLQAAGQVCTDMVDLSTLGAQMADTISGTLTVSGGVATLSASLSVVSPVPPGSTGLGTLTISGEVVAAGEVPVVSEPCPCDRTGDNLQTVDDYFAYLGSFFEQLDGAGDADLSGDNLVTVDDFFVFLNCLPAISVNSACP